MSDLNWVSVWAFENNRTSTCLRQSPGIQVCIMGALGRGPNTPQGRGDSREGERFLLGTNTLQVGGTARH